MSDSFSRKEIMMKRYGILCSAFKLSLLVLCGALFSMALVRAQEAGGDLGGGAGIFSPKNPETKRRTTGIKPPTNNGRTSERNTATGGRPAALPPEVIEERFENALDEGNT